jgi:hypothetical protein
VVASGNYEVVEQLAGDINYREKSIPGHNNSTRFKSSKNMCNFVIA